VESPRLIYIAFVAVTWFRGVMLTWYPSLRSARTSICARCFLALGSASQSRSMNRTPSCKIFQTKRQTMRNGHTSAIICCAESTPSPGTSASRIDDHDHQHFLVYVNSRDLHRFLLAWKRQNAREKVTHRHVLPPVLSPEWRDTDWFKTRVPDQTQKRPHFIQSANDLC